MPVILITGASQGIGAAMAEAFAAEPDARLALLARNRERLEAVAERCRGLGAHAEVFPCDVTDDDAVRETARAILDRWGAPDVLVNNAGRFAPGDAFGTTPDAFRAQVAVNLTSAFVVTHAFLPAMVARGSGHVFFLGSVASIRAYPGGLAYCAAKHGVLGLARAVREDTKDRGIRVTALLPGATLTPSWDGVDLPPERFMPPEDVARAAVDVYRLSDRTVVEELLLRPQLGDL
ncbi:SDR family oxidoreductase [Rhodocaloribacter sp.]